MQEDFQMSEYQRHMTVADDAAGESAAHYRCS